MSFFRSLKKKNPWPMTHFGLFACMWSLAMLTHVNNRMDWFDTIPYFLLCVSVFLFFIKPSTKTFVLAMFVQIISWYVVMPNIDNHWLFSAFICIPIVAAFVAEYFSVGKQWNKVDAEKVFVWLAPILRLTVFLMYAFVVLHKFNADFFDPEVSCAVHFYERLMRQDFTLPLPGKLPLFFEYVVIVSAYGFLLAAALGLSNPRGWIWGIIGGLLFHVPTLILMRHFPTIMFALYVLFIPSPVAKKLIASAEKFLKKRTNGKLNLFNTIFLYAIITTIARLIRYGADKADVYEGTGRMIFTIYARVQALFITGVILIILYYIFKRGLQSKPVKSLFTTSKKWMYIFPIIFAINCSFPYLGLKTMTSVAMWSNLRTENGVSNHFIIGGKAFKLFGYQEDVVRIIDSNRGRFRRYAREEKLQVWHMFKRRVHEAVMEGRGDIDIEIERNGERIFIENAEEYPVFQKPESHLSQKFLHFRTFPDSTKKFPCSW